MKNKTIIILVVSVLVVGLVFLGTEVKNLRAEVSRLSQFPAVAAAPVVPSVGQAPSAMAKPVPAQPRAARRPADPWGVFNDPWDSYSDLARIQGQMDQLFNQAFRGGLGLRQMPAADVYRLSSDVRDEKDKYVVNMDLPGMDKNNINVEVKNNALFVSGERKSKSEENNGNYYQQERSFGYFSQSLPLPADADSSAISVNYEKGVLTIDIPKLAKAQTEKETTKIKVN